MQVYETKLNGIKRIELKLFGDARGFFVERFNAQKFAEHGLPTQFVQDNHSRSGPGILRGLHYQTTPAQGKLVGVIRGRMLDVVVDIRPESPTFGQHITEELTGENGVLLWVPPGFAHGFCVLGDEPVDILYKVTALYNPQGEGGLRYNDPELGIDWPIENPILSERDQLLGSLDDIRRNSPVWQNS